MLAILKDSPENRQVFFYQLGALNLGANSAEIVKECGVGFVSGINAVDGALACGGEGGY